MQLNGDRTADFLVCDEDLDWTFRDVSDSLDTCVDIPKNTELGCAVVKEAYPKLPNALVMQTYVLF